MSKIGENLDWRIKQSISHSGENNYLYGKTYEEYWGKEKAEELYKFLLKLNPGDNQGVRYTLSGLYAGISGEEINDMFDEGNQKQNWDKLEKLVKIQNKKHHFWEEPKYE